MRVTDYRTGAPCRAVDGEEDALVVLRDSVEAHFRVVLNDSFMEVYAQPDAPQRSLRTALAGTDVLGGAFYGDEREGSWRRRREFAFDVFTARNVTSWPVPPSELRRDGDLAYAATAELAARLNRRLREDAAQVFRECAGFVRQRYVLEADPDLTLWARFCEHSGLGALSVDEVADAVAAGPVQWTPATGWTSAGGADGDPFMVCRYRWGPLVAAVRLEPAELLARHLAGDAEMALYRVFMDYGDGRVEIIWPHQNVLCCGLDGAFDGARPPMRVNNWRRPGAAPTAESIQCRVCGGVRYGSWLTCRAARRDPTLPLGVVEALDALPAETLTAARDDGLAAVAPELPVTR